MKCELHSSAFDIYVSVTFYIISHALFKNTFLLKWFKIYFWGEKWIHLCSDPADACIFDCL